MMDPIQTARDYADKIFDVHLKDTEIRWDVLRRVGINPVKSRAVVALSPAGLGFYRLGGILHGAATRRL